MTGFVIALSGGIGAGKSALAAALKEAFDADVVSFGEEVRTFARENDLNPDDRSVLQQLGQALVLTDREEFVRRVLAQRQRHQGPTGEERPLIVQGLRHIEILFELEKQIKGTPVYLVHIETPDSTREARVMERDKVERRAVGRYDNDISEAQVSRILPQYAQLKVRGDIPPALQVIEIRKWLDLRKAERLTTAA